MKPVLLASLCLALAGCTAAPEWYRIPPQHGAVDSKLNPDDFQEYFKANELGSDAFIVNDVLGVDGDMRWTRAEPEFRFIIASTANRRFRMDFNIHDVTFKDTGPVTLVFAVNGHELARETFDTPGRRVFEKPVPAEWLTTVDENRVVVHVLNPWATPNPDDKLGFIFYGAGFVR